MTEYDRNKQEDDPDKCLRYHGGSWAVTRTGASLRANKQTKYVHEIQLVQGESLIEAKDHIQWAAIG